MSKTPFQWKGVFVKPRIKKAGLSSGLRACASVLLCVVFGEQIEAILVHAYALTPGVEREVAVQRLRYPELELPGI